MLARSLLLHAPRSLRWVEEDLPSPAAGQVLVRTDAGAISIGSELPFYTGMARAFLPPSYPKMTGYESVGRVVAVGSDVEYLTVGDRVVAPYGHRTAALVRADKAIKVPPEIDDALALLVILTCDVAKGIGKLRPAAGEPILVTGAGAIGLLTVWMLGRTGRGLVDVVEPIAARRDVARDLGARHLWSPDSMPPAPTYRLGVECSSANAGFGALLRAMLPSGRICILADGLIEPLTLAPEFHERDHRHRLERRRRLPRARPLVLSYRCPARQHAALPLRSDSRGGRPPGHLRPPGGRPARRDQSPRPLLNHRPS